MTYLSESIDVQLQLVCSWCHTASCSTAAGCCTGAALAAGAACGADDSDSFIIIVLYVLVFDDVAYVIIRHIVWWCVALVMFIVVIGRDIVSIVTDVIIGYTWSCRNNYIFVAIDAVGSWCLIILVIVAGRRCCCCRSCCCWWCCWRSLWKLRRERVTQVNKYALLIKIKVRIQNLI